MCSELFIIQSESGDKSNATYNWGSQKIIRKKGSAKQQIPKKGFREAKSLGTSVQE